jgi:hypothetical protein
MTTTGPVLKLHTLRHDTDDHDDCRLAAALQYFVSKGYRRSAGEESLSLYAPKGREKRNVMKFGVLYDFRNPPQTQWFMPWPEFYAGVFAHMQEMERLGFDAISLCEHHGDPDGYNPGIAVTMTAAAMRTQRVRITSNIIQLPFYTSQGQELRFFKALKA